MHPASRTTFRIPLDGVRKERDQHAQLVIDGSGLPMDRRSGLSGAQVNLARFVWVNRAGTSLGFCAKEGNVSFYHLGCHIINLSACRVEPAEEVSEATCVGAKRVG